jgi:hypothetical protein
MRPAPFTLVVVEEPMIGKLIDVMLRRENFTVVATDASHASALLRSEDFPGILLTNTPEDFLEFSATVRLLYVSGAPNPEIPQLFRRCRVVRKPFGLMELVDAVKELMEL